ncbi:F-box/FBD/LRR-repeat protein, partial [Dissostichus eleginoides]
AQKLVSNLTVDTAQCVNHQLDESADSKANARSAAADFTFSNPSSVLLALTVALIRLKGFQLL